MHEYFRQIWHIFRIYCPDVSCEQHLWKPNSFPWACAGVTEAAPYMSQLLIFPVQSWRGLHLSELNMDFATASCSQDLSKPSSPALTAPALDSAVLWARPTSPDEWRAFSCQSLARVTPQKNFPLQLLGSALGLALAPGNPDFLWPPQSLLDVQQILSFSFSPTDTSGRLKSATIKWWLGNTWASQVPPRQGTKVTHRNPQLLGTCTACSHSASTASPPRVTAPDYPTSDNSMEKPHSWLSSCCRTARTARSGLSCSWKNS